MPARKAFVRTLPALVCAGLMLSFFSGVASADAGINRLLASQCAQCHGTDGQAVGDMDGLAGEELQDLYDDLLDFQKKDDHDVMHYQIKGYTNDQLYRIALYYSALPEGDDDD